VIDYDEDDDDFDLLLSRINELPPQVFQMRRQQFIKETMRTYRDKFVNNPLFYEHDLLGYLQNKALDGQPFVDLSMQLDLEQVIAINKQD